MAQIDAKRLKELENYANSFFISGIPVLNNISLNLNLLYDLSKLIIDNLHLNENDKIYINCDIFSKKTPIENIELVKGYYKNNEIFLNVDNLVNDGTIDMIYKHHKGLAGGKNYHDNDKKIIECDNNGIITDSIVLIHELSHYRNQPDKEENITRRLLTEALAFAEEFIYMDYLFDNGYVYEIESWKRSLVDYFYNLSKKMLSVYKLLILYREMSSLSIESYELYYGDVVDYERHISVVDKYVKDNMKFLNNTEYILGFNLAIYMYYEYKKNSDFWNKIQALHFKMNVTDVISCLKIIDLNDLGDEDKEIISLALQQMNNEIEILNNNANKKSLK